MTLPLPFVAEKGDDQESSELHEALISRGENIGLIILDPGSLFSCWENMVRLVVGRTLSSVSR